MAKWRLNYAAKFVSRWEGFSAEAYLDTLASPAVWTIGYGHTGPIFKGGRWREIQAGDTITRRQALKYLTKDLRTAARAVRQSVHVPITVRQRMALISLCFNIGVGAFQSSTLVKKLNAKDYRGAANEFPKWKFAGGVPVLGLLNRRRLERWMFTHPLRPQRA